MKAGKAQETTAQIQGGEKNQENEFGHDLTDGGSAGRGGGGRRSCYIISLRGDRRRDDVRRLGDGATLTAESSRTRFGFTSLMA